jgi:hypothetical protein
MYLLKQLREATGLTKYAMAEALHMKWSNYDRAEQKGVMIRLDHLHRAIVLAQKHGIPISEVCTWIQKDHDTIERKKSK